MDADNTATHVTDLVRVLPRVLIVSRRTIRKNKFVDFVGEYHLDLIVKYGAVPVIVPRVPGVHLLLDSFEPIHGVLLCEGEDIDPSNYNHNDVDFDSLSPEEIEEIRSLHSSDTAIDKAKDSIELHLAKRCLERNIPYLGICRGSQVLNVACGGTLYQDVEKELSKKGGVKVEHINYDNYDNHRHIVKVLQETPLHDWFRESLEPSTMELLVNSYHHQGVKKLADRFKPMAYAPDGLIEAFYDPNTYDPEHGKFIMGLQFHPERMRHMQDDASFADDTSSEFDYPGCPCAYQEFVKAVLAYQKKLMSPMNNKKSQVGVMKLNSAMEKQRKKLMRSFSMAKLIYEDQNTNNNVMEGIDLDTGVEFLEASMMPLKMSELENEKRLKQMGATVRNSASYKERVLKGESVEALLKELPTRQLLDLLDVYKTVVHVGTQVIHDRLQNNINVSPNEHIDLPN